MHIQKIVGKNIRGYRKRIQWTQEKLAIRAKITPQHIGRLELGKENFKICTLISLTKALKIEIHKLFIEESYKTEE